MYIQSKWREKGFELNIYTFSKKYRLKQKNIKLNSFDKETLFNMSTISNPDDYYYSISNGLLLPTFLLIIIHALYFLANTRYIIYSTSFAKLPSK